MTNEEKHFIINGLKTWLFLSLQTVTGRLNPFAAVFSLIEAAIAGLEKRTETIPSETTDPADTDVKTDNGTSADTPSPQTGGQQSDSAWACPASCKRLRHLCRSPLRQKKKSDKR